MRFTDFDDDGKDDLELLTGGKNRPKRLSSGAHEFDIESKENESKRTNKYVMACAIFASLKSILVGYDVGVMSGAIIFMKEDLNLTEMQVQFFVGSMSIFSLFGSLAGGKVSDIIGRKWTMVVAAVVVQIGAAVMASASSINTLIIGRFLSGAGIGLGMLITPVYIAEISPTFARGSLTSFPSFLINFGVLLGYVSNYSFSQLSVHTGWRIMLAIGIFPSVFIIIALLVIPESPRWLIMRNRVDKARQVLSKMMENSSEVEQRLVEIQLAGNSSAGNHKPKAVWKEFLSPTPPLRRMLIAGIGIQCFQQLTGINATLYYTPEILKSAGIRDMSNVLAATVAVGLSKSMFILIAIFLIDKLGRKPLLYLSSVGMTACLFFLGVTLLLLKETSVGVALSIIIVCANVAFFSLGMSPVGWVISSEIYPQRLRAQAAVLCAVGHRLCSGFVATSFLSAARAFSVGGTFMLFSGISAVSVWFVYAYVPETKGKSLEQIEQLFKNENE